MGGISHPAGAFAKAQPGISGASSGYMGGFGFTGSNPARPAGVSGQVFVPVARASISNVLTMRLLLAVLVAVTVLVSCFSPWLKPTQAAYQASNTSADAVSGLSGLSTMLGGSSYNSEQYRLASEYSLYTLQDFYATVQSYQDAYSNMRAYFQNGSAGSTSKSVTPLEANFRIVPIAVTVLGVIAIMLLLVRGSVFFTNVTMALLLGVDIWVAASAGRSDSQLMISGTMPVSMVLMAATIAASIFVWSKQKTIRA